MLGRRGFALESTAARMCREARGRVRTNVFVRDMDLPEPRVADARRLEVVVDSLFVGELNWQWTPAERSIGGRGWL